MKKTSAKGAGKAGSVPILGRTGGNDSKIRRSAEEARINAVVAQLIYNSRIKAGLTQAALAALIGTKQSAVARFEDSGSGHSLSTLLRIAAALNLRLDIRLTPFDQVQ